MQRKRLLLIGLVATALTTAVVVSVVWLSGVDWEPVGYRLSSDSDRIAIVEHGVREGRFIGWTPDRAKKSLGTFWAQYDDPNIHLHRVGSVRGRSAILILTYKEGVVAEAEVGWSTD
jgi:hypothetical protein